VHRSSELIVPVEVLCVNQGTVYANAPQPLSRYIGLRVSNYLLLQCKNIKRIRNKAPYSVGPQECPPQTGPRSVQPFCTRDGLTDTPHYGNIGRNRPHR